MRVRVVGFPVYGIRYSDTGIVCSIPVWLTVYSHAAYSCTVNRYRYCAVYCIPVPVLHRTSRFRSIPVVLVVLVRYR